MQAQQDDFTPITIQEYAAMLRRRWWLLIIAPAVAVIVAFLVTQQQETLYESSASILVSQLSPSGAVANSDIQTANALARTYEKFVLTRPVLERAVNALQSPQNVDTLRSELTVSVDPDSPIIRIGTRQQTPADAARVANAVSEQFIAWLSESQVIPIGTGTQVAIGSRAEVPGAAPPPPTLRNMALAALLAVVIAGAGAITLERLSPRVRSSRDVERSSGLPILAFAPRSRRGEVWEVLNRPESGMSNAFRTLRAWLELATHHDGTRVIVIVGSAKADGSASVAGALATSFALGGHQTLLVDANLRDPRQHELFGLRSMPAGLADALGAWPTGDIERLLENGPAPKLRRLHAGTNEALTAEVLATPQRLAGLIQCLRAQAEIVVIDAPPMLKDANALLLAGMADEVLVVARSGRTRPEQLARVVEMLRPTGADIPGAILVGSIGVA